MGSSDTRNPETTEMSDDNARASEQDKLLGPIGAGPTARSFEPDPVSAASANDSTVIEPANSVEPPANSVEPPAEPAPAKPKRASKKPRARSRSGIEPNNVRKLRQEAMMSKAELARRAGVSPLTIDRVEAGCPCRMDTKRKILEALGLKPSARTEVWPDIDAQS